MKTSMYGQISLTKLGEIAKKHPALVKEVEFKDGHKEKFVNISILVNDQQCRVCQLSDNYCKMKEDCHGDNPFVFVKAEQVRAMDFLRNNL